MSVSELYTMAGVVVRRGEEEGEFVKLLGPGPAWSGWWGCIDCLLVLSRRSPVVING